MENKHIRFVLDGTSESGRTRIWNVEATRDGHWLGEVKWMGRWYRYAFWPTPDTVFEQNCLRTIAAFCEEMTKEQRGLSKPKQREASGS